MTCESTKHNAYFPPGTHILIIDEQGTVPALQRFAFILLSHFGGGEGLLLIYSRNATTNCKLLKMHLLMPLRFLSQRHSRGLFAN